jgi:hypothetical protein
MVNLGKTERKKTGEIMEKTICIAEDNKYMKGIDKVDQYLAYYSILRKTKKVIQTLHQSQNVKYRKLLLEAGKAWVIE